jgi:hypothetical protein
VNVIYKQRDHIFKNNTTEYTRSLELLNSAEDFVKKRVNVLGKLTAYIQELFQK